MRILLCAVAAILTFVTSAQVNKYHDLQGQAVKVTDFFTNQESALGLSASDSWRPIDEVSNQLGIHHRYQQLYKGVPIVNAHYILHADSQGRVMSANGLVATIDGIDVTPSLTQGQVRDHLLSRDDVKHLDEVDLVIVDEAFPSSSGRYLLAYAAAVGLDQDHRTIYIDAHTGREVAYQSHVCYHTVPGQGESFYYGNLSFNVDSLGPEDYLLYDAERDIRVYNDNDNRSEYRSPSPTFDLVNDDKDQIAIDLLWASAGFYDMMRDRFDWVGLDGDSLALEGIVHINQGLPFVNAFWNGEFTHYGDGDCHHSPLASAMIVAHEYMHGVTDYTSDLIYADESGALNEGMSDIFGKYAQYLLLPDDFDWTVDTTIKATDLGRVFRDMSDPLSKGNPAYYGGQNWQPGGSVHNNSAILNYWFYLLSEGKQGVNEVGYQYDVSPIGIDAAAQITWLCQSSYLTPSSTYADMQAASLQVTTQLYGDDSPELAAVTEAWEAVGLGSPSTEMISDIVIQVVTPRNICETDGAVDLEILLTNVGTGGFPAQTVEFVVSDFSTEERYMVDIDSLIDPLATYLVEITDAFPVSTEDNSFFFVDVAMVAADDVMDNNATSFFASNSVNLGVDLTPTFGLFSLEDCETGAVELRLQVANEGCETYFGSNDVVARLTAPGGADIGTATLPSIGFLPGGASTVLLTTDVDIAVALEDLPFVGIEIEVADDNNGDNNSVDVQQPLRLLDLTMVEDFETLESAAWEGDNFEVVDYQGNAMLAASSALTTDSDFYNLCDDLNFVLADRFAGQSVTSSTACVDLTGLRGARLTFDLIQFRTIEGADLPEYEDLTVFTAVEYMGDDGEPVREFIYGLPEGELTEQQVELPQDYVGTVTIYLFSKLGDWLEFPPLDRDCQLIDNIRIESLVSTERVPTSGFYITPNPAVDQVVVGGIDVASYTIYDVQGRQRLAGQLDRPSIDVSALRAGVYLISVQSTMGRVITERFVKM